MALYGERPFVADSWVQLLRALSAGEVGAPPRGTTAPAWLRGGPADTGLAHADDSFRRAGQRLDARQQHVAGTGEDIVNEAVEAVAGLPSSAARGSRRPRGWVMIRCRSGPGRPSTNPGVGA